MAKTPTTWIRKDAVVEMTGATYTTIHRHMRAGTFPAAKYHFGKLRWNRREVERWLRDQPDVTDPAARRQFNVTEARKRRW